MLQAIGAAAVVAAARAASADPASSIGGTVEFEGGAVIPEGEVEIYIEDPATGGDARRRAVGARLESDGGSRMMDFAFSPTTGSQSARIVARLERADGWLLARGSAKLEINSPVHILLRPAMY